MASSRIRPRLLLAVALPLLLLPNGSGGEAQGRRADSEVEAYLLTLGLGASQLRAAERGEAAVKLLKTQDGRDVAVAGVIGVRALRAVAVARVLDDPAFIAAGASRFGAFEDPPGVGDVRGVVFDRSEYRELRGCRPGDCKFKMSAGEMAAFARGVDWSAPNAKAQADEHLRTEIVRLVADYRRRGNAAMPTYNNGGGEVRASDAFSALVAQSGEMAAFAPDVVGYLTTYPVAQPIGARNLVYWSESRIGRMRPTLTVNHVVTYAPATGTAFLAKKQIYANHYFEGGMEAARSCRGKRADRRVRASGQRVCDRRALFPLRLSSGGSLQRARPGAESGAGSDRTDSMRTRAAIEKPDASLGVIPTP